jgi:hypothetical protein
MAFDLHYLIAFAGLLTLFQLYVSIRMLFYGGYGRGQKIVQLLIVWLVPLFGGLLVNSFLTSDEKKQHRHDTRFTPDEGNNPTGMNVPPST